MPGVSTSRCRIAPFHPLQRQSDRTEKTPQARVLGKAADQALLLNDRVGKALDIGYWQQESARNGQNTGPPSGRVTLVNSCGAWDSFAVRAAVAASACSGVAPSMTMASRLAFCGNSLSKAISRCRHGRADDKRRAVSVSILSRLRYHPTQCETHRCDDGEQDYSPGMAAAPVDQPRGCIADERRKTVARFGTVHYRVVSNPKELSRRTGCRRESNGRRPPGPANGYGICRGQDR